MAVSVKSLTRFSMIVRMTVQEMDLLEMVIYGDIDRPGRRCKCKTQQERDEKYVSSIKKTKKRSELTSIKDCTEQ